MPALQPITWGMGIPFRNHGKTYPAVLAVRGVFDPWLIKGLLGRPRPILKQLGPSWWWPTKHRAGDDLAVWYPFDSEEWAFWWILSSCMEISCHVAQQLLDSSCICSSFLIWLFGFVFLFSALFNSSSCNCGCCGCDCYRCCVVIVPVVAVVAFVLLLVGLCCRLSCFQHQLELSALSALSAGCIDPPVISVVSAKATVDLPNILEHLRSCQSSPEGTWVNVGHGSILCRGMSGTGTAGFQDDSGCCSAGTMHGKRHSYQVRWTRPFLPAFELCLSKRKKVSMKSCWWNLMTQVTRV